MRIQLAIPAALLASLQPKERREVDTWLRGVEGLFNTPEQIAERERMRDELVAFGRTEIRVPGTPR